MSVSTLDRIQNILDEAVADSNGDMVGSYFGMCTESKLSKWNYFVFRRKELIVSGAGLAKSFQPFYEINIIHEDYIPEGFVEKVIKKLEKTEPGYSKLKVTSNKVSFDYVQKGNTDKTVEIASFVLTKPEKRY